VKGSALIDGATGATYTLPNVGASDAGEYRAIVTNDVGSLPSNPATLTVGSTNPGRLSNLSILTRVTAADPVIIVGTVVGGAGTSPNASKPVLIRAAGPSLSTLGVQGVLPDPRLEVYREQTSIGSNDNWGGGAALVTAFTELGAFGYSSPGSADAALSAALTGGNHSVHVRGAAGSAGMAIAEIYDATPTAAFSATTPRLINVSVRTQIEAGTVLTAGFVIAGNSSRNVLIRAVGPTLGTAFGVTGVMANPRFDVFSGQTVIGSNDNWGGGAPLTVAFTSVGAFQLPATSSDAALLLNLTPGSYTAQVSGVSGTGGVTLVEVYEVP
jgi:hypothetical protein